MQTPVHPENVMHIFKGSKQPAQCSWKGREKGITHTHLLLRVTMGHGNQHKVTALSQR